MMHPPSPNDPPPYNSSIASTWMQAQRNNNVDENRTTNYVPNRATEAPRWGPQALIGWNCATKRERALDKHEGATCRNNAPSLHTHSAPAALTRVIH